MRVEVERRLEQEALLHARVSYSPGGAAQYLGVARQTVHDWVKEDRLLLWVFPIRRTHPNTWEMYVDFGPRQEDDIGSVNDWRASSQLWKGHNPDDLISEAVRRYVRYLAEQYREELVEEEVK